MIINEIVRVLLADDDRDEREGFTEAFETLKIATKVNTVKNGDELMDHLNNPSGELPHVVFLDLNILKKTGSECLAQIRQTERLKNLTIVTYSTSSSEKDIEDTFLNGANVYVKKPAHLTMLKKTLLQVLTVNWQYHTWGLNRDTFLLKL